MHAINVAIAHLDFEAILASPRSSSSAQAGRPFVITDPNPPITFRDMYFLVQTLAVTPFRTVALPPILMVLLSYPVEWYSLALAKFPVLQRFLPALTGDVKHLKPGIFSICTHLVASNAVASRPVSEGGLGYSGVLTTLEGMAQELVDWNRDHTSVAVGGERKTYQTSVSLADEIARAAATVQSVAGS